MNLFIYLEQTDFINACSDIHQPEDGNKNI